MAMNQSRRLRPDDLDADRAAVVAVQSITNYQPFNPSYTTQALQDLNTARDAAQQAEIRAQQAFDAARDAACAAEWALHNAVIGARTQMRAQYGDDSDEVQAMGLKKSSERKRPSRPARPTTLTSE